MPSDWEASQQAFGDASAWFVRVVGLVGERWDASGLGEWDVRSLVGHTSRSFLTVESYLGQPADVIDCPTAVDYYRATSAIAAGAGVADRGREAGRALGDDPASAVSSIADRVGALVAGCTGCERLTTAGGGMVLSEYLPTRTFELTVHTCDLCVALSVPLDVPTAAAAQTLYIIGDLAVETGRAGPLMLAATGRTTLPAGFTLL